MTFVPESVLMQSITEAKSLERDPRCKPYAPRGAVKELFYCKKKEVLVDGPAGTGKTRGILEKINLCLLKYPGSRALIARKTRASMTESVLVTLEKVLPDNPKIYPPTNDTLRRIRQGYEYPNGSAIIVGGLDNPERIMSTEYDLIAVFEGTELIESEWEMGLTRLRNGVMPYQQAMIDCNPSYPAHWLNRRGDLPGMARLISRHEDNPLLFTKEGVVTTFGTDYLETLERLTGPRKARLRYGKWVAAEGVVYPDYNAAVHLIDRFHIPSDWRRIRSIDFGFTNPFVCQWWAIDNDGRMYLYRQIYMSNRLVEDHARHILQLSQSENIEETVCDHDLEDRKTLERYGVNTIPAYKSIEVGIQGATKRLQTAGDGRARVFILRDSLVDKDQVLIDTKLPTCMEEEFDSYLRQPGDDRKNPKELPIDKDNHGMDSFRYAVSYVDDLASQPFEVVTSGFSGVEMNNNG